MLDLEDAFPPLAVWNAQMGIDPPMPGDVYHCPRTIPQLNFLKILRHEILQDPKAKLPAMVKSRYHPSHRDGSIKRQGSIG